MAIFTYDHPTVDSDGRPMSESEVKVNIFSPDGTLVREARTYLAQAPGMQVTQHVPLTAEEAAAATGGTAEAVVLAGGSLSASIPVSIPAPAEGVKPTTAGVVENFTYRNS